MHTFYAYLARMKYIQRWGLMRNSFPENDAEHTLQTIMIAHGLAVIREKIFHESCDAEHCAMLAVYHDAYKEIEDKARRRLLETLPDELKDTYRPYILDMENDPLWPLAKAADTLSAYLKCAEEIQAGNSEFEEAFRTTENKLKNLHLKEVDWFLEHFAGSFALTLDEMNRM